MTKNTKKYKIFFSFAKYYFISEKSDFILAFFFWNIGSHQTIATFKFNSHWKQKIFFLLLYLCLIFDISKAIATTSWIFSSSLSLSFFLFYCYIKHCEHLFGRSPLVYNQSDKILHKRLSSRPLFKCAKCVTSLFIVISFSLRSISSLISKETTHTHTIHSSTVYSLHSKRQAFADSLFEKALKIREKDIHEMMIIII